MCVVLIRVYDKNLNCDFWREKRNRSSLPLPCAARRGSHLRRLEMTDKQSKVKAIVRIRPFLPNEVHSSCVKVSGQGQLELRNLKFNPPTEAINYKYVALVDDGEIDDYIYLTKFHQA